jgi:hypothetical protein
MPSNRSSMRVFFSANFHRPGKWSFQKTNYGISPEWTIAAAQNSLSYLPGAESMTLAHLRNCPKISRGTRVTAEIIREDDIPVGVWIKSLVRTRLAGSFWWMHRHLRLRSGFMGNRSDKSRYRKTAG